MRILTLTITKKLRWTTEGALRTSLDSRQSLESLEEGAEGPNNEEDQSMDNRQDTQLHNSRFEGESQAQNNYHLTLDSKEHRHHR